MENSTAFILNDAIQSWRDTLGRSPSLREQDLAELEAHLRDSVAALQSRGLTDEEAFLLATRRLGYPAGLEPEFAKVNRSEVWLHRLLWMLVGIQVWSLVSVLSHTATDAAVLGGLAGLGYKFRSSVQGPVAWWPDFGVGAALYAFVNLLALAGCVIGCWCFARRMENCASKVAARALRRPILVGLAATVLFLMINLSWSAESMVLHRYYAPAAVATIATSRSLAYFVLGLLQTTAFVVLTILLLRRRFRLNRASYPAGP